MTPETFLELYGDRTVLAAGGALIGGVFGFMAQRSKFCLRAAVLEFWHWRFGEKTAVWLLAFSSAVILVQGLVLLGWLDSSSARQIATRGSISGALLGGLLFGAGMVMTRGCASRLLILSANGNLRALLGGLIFAVTAQASLSGILAPLRTAINSWWTVEGGPSRDLLTLFNGSHEVGLLLGVAWLLAALFFTWRSPARPLGTWLAAVATGAMVAAAWGFTQWMASVSFDPLPVQGLTFSGPSAEWLMRVLHTPAPPISFEFGMLPGAFIGAGLGAWWGRELRLEGFKDGHSMRRYILGAIFMGFGSVLAGGCAVGAGVTGGAIFALTAWITLVGMWVGAGLMDRWLDAASHGQP